MSARTFQYEGVVRLTRSGAGFLLFAFFIGFAALNTGNNSLYIVFAMMLACLIFSGIVSRFGLKAISAEVLELGEVWAEENAYAVVRVANRSRWIEVRDLVIRSPDLDASAIVGRIGPKTSEDLPVNFVFRRRGWVRLRRLELYTIFPFGFFSKKRRVAVDAKGVVYPSRLDVARARRMAADAGEERPVNRAGEGQDLFALRDYREGESIRHIHWKRSASAGRWIVRQSAADSSDRLHVIFDPVATGGSEEEFENLVKGAAGFIADALEHGQDVVLHIGTDSFDSTGDASRIFTALALIERQESGSLPAAPPGSVVFSMRHEQN